jgi:hypothetical protein
MRALRALLGGLVWIVACLVGLVGALLSVTLVLAPVGIPLLFLAKRLFGTSMALFLPRAMRHPAQELAKKGRKAADDARDTAGKTAGKMSGKKKTGPSRLWGRKRPWWERLVEGFLQPR